MGLGGRDALLLAGLTKEQHAAYVAARADLIEARATREGVPAAEEAFDATVARLRAEAPRVAALAWPPKPPLAAIQRALRPDEALVMAHYDLYVKCALVVTQDKAVLRAVEGPGFDKVADLLAGKRTALLASSGPLEPFAAPKGMRLSFLPTAAMFLEQRAAPRPRGTGVAVLGAGPERLGAPAERLPEGRLATVYLGVEDLSPLLLLRARIDADTVVVAGPGGPLALPAAALLAGGAGNVVVGGRPPSPLDIFLDAFLSRKAPLAAAALEASAKGPLFLHGAPE